ncbi:MULTISPECIES: helix-turn-helix domain-containing protein [Halorussus]|uniref:helix-turn-helix domain-containing protein n=1 Tax=Halorussus TaxID=1070314 RepID=UPI0020A0AC07|nr:helix-turn-helix domain-containing protein [Halorussus vallis]USZ75435.1 helix-turn-helix domain-containing protein [Halorussus vallis]
MTDDQPLSPADAFGLVADETRLRILRALGSAPYEEFEGTLRFSELRERAAVRDSGKFNYHLRKLVGPFVREREDGYTLNYAGELLYRTVVAGFFTDDADLENFDADAPCPTCGTTLRARYEDNRLRLACEDCGREYQDVPYPPSAVEAWDDDELLSAFDQWGRHNILLFNRGVCKWCGGPMPGEFRRVSGEGLTGDRESAVYVARACGNCNGFMYTTPGETVLYHPATVSFFHDRGVDVTARPLWELDFVADGVREVRSEDPWEVVVAVECDGDELRFVLDDDVEVTAVETPEE